MKSTARAAIAGILLALPGFAAAENLEDEFARVDRAIKTNPGRVTGQALDSCIARRKAAAELYQLGQDARARRRLRYCEQVLKIPARETARAERPAPPTPEELAARAMAEYDRAIALTPNLENGLEIYRECAMCHMPEGWGLVAGTVPQIAGQHRTVLIKQLADMRAGNRDAVPMLPYASLEAIGGPQSLADVTGYIDTLEISVATGKGPGEDLDRGEAIYQEMCASCHGVGGEGDAERAIPRIHSQHYGYLVRQFEWIRDGRRRNANPEMVAQIQGFGSGDVQAVLDYVSRLEPSPALQAPAGWLNPDFGE